MAIFQCHIQVISRGEGRSVVSAAAYRSASRIENNYTGLTPMTTPRRAGWNTVKSSSRQMHPGNGMTPGYPLECSRGSRKEQGLQAGTGD